MECTRSTNATLICTTYFNSCTMPTGDFGLQGIQRNLKLDHSVNLISFFAALYIEHIACVWVSFDDTAPKISSDDPTWESIKLAKSKCKDTEQHLLWAKKKHYTQTVQTIQLSMMVYVFSKISLLISVLILVMCIIDFQRIKTMLVVVSLRSNLEMSYGIESSWSIIWFICFCGLEQNVAHYFEFSYVLAILDSGTVWTHFVVLRNDKLLFSIRFKAVDKQSKKSLPGR